MAWSRVGAALLGAALLAAAQPPGPGRWLGWLAPVPLLWAIGRAKSGAAAFGLCLLAGAVFWALHIAWVLPAAGLGWWAAIPVLGACFGPLGPLVRLAGAAPPGVRWAGAAAAWVALEWLRLHLGFASTPWGLLGYTQVEFAAAAQLAALGGVYAISFAVAGFAAGLAALADRGRKRGAWELGVAGVCVGLALLWGAGRAAEANADRTLRVAMVQAGFYARGVDPPERRREIFRSYRDLGHAALSQAPQLIAWPASSVPAAVPWDRLVVRTLERHADELGVPVLVGSTGQDKARPGTRTRPTANSAFLLTPDRGVSGRYDKIRLLPFNEYAPLRGRVRWPEWIGRVTHDAAAGSERTVFELSDARFGVLICWENLFPDGFRAAAPGLDFAVSMTNEAFTESRVGHHQMRAMNRFRAIETGVPIVRTATTGISEAVDGRGRVVGRIEDAAGEPFGAVGVRVVELPLRSEVTPYARHGDAWLLATPLLLLLCAASRVARR